MIESPSGDRRIERPSGVKAITGGTNQKPQRRAAERDEEEIEHFRTERAAELQKKPSETTEH
jgi:hypothetical protein